jgi:hypothetical protein
LPGPVLHQKPPWTLRSRAASSPCDGRYPMLCRWPAVAIDQPAAEMVGGWPQRDRPRGRAASRAVAAFQQAGGSLGAGRRWPAAGRRPRGRAACGCRRRQPGGVCANGRPVWATMTFVAKRLAIQATRPRDLRPGGRYVAHHLPASPSSA